jgi:hypothetical protein
MTKILVKHIHERTVMSDEHIVSLQSSMQFLPIKLPIIILQRVEEIFPAFRVTMVIAICLCAYERIISYNSEELCGTKNKMFSRNVMLSLIFCGLGS